MPLFVRALLGALAAGVALLAAQAVGAPVPDALVDPLYHGVQIGAVAACAARALSDPRERDVWLLLTAGLGSFAAGDLYYTLFLEGMDAPPFPSGADPLYLAIYPLTYLALVRLVRARAPRLPLAVWVDALVAGLTLAAAGAAVLVPAVAAETGGPPLTVATNIAYPVGDLLLLSLLAGVAFLASWRVGRTWLLLTVGFVIFAGVDAAYLIETARGTYVEGSLLDVGWPGAFAVLAAAAWQRPHRLSTLRVDRWGALVLPIVCGAISLGLLVLDHFDRQAVTALVLSTAAIAAVQMRLVVTFGENLRMLARSRTEATTDALTGLGNRRALLSELREALLSGRPHLLALYDLDGFKGYNDRFGHADGDELLTRLGEAATAALGRRGRLFRMGGDEFCLLAEGAPADLAATVRDAMTFTGDGYVVGCSYGAVALPSEAEAAGEALRLADRRMYADKRPNPLGLAA